LISYSLAALAAAGIETVICAKRGQELPPLGVQVLEEPEELLHPLCGIVAALRLGRPLVVVACDLPFVTAGLIRLLADAPEPLVMPVLDGRPQPLLARYEPSLLPELEAALEREEPLARTVEALGPRLLGEDELAPFGDPHRLLFNVNDPADLQEAETLF
jgi:molybdopterin-guanine dinucleotide biosynthesis protein A